MARIRALLDIMRNAFPESPSLEHSTAHPVTQAVINPIVTYVNAG
jgi:hypothetical protein